MESMKTCELNQNLSPFYWIYLPVAGQGGHCLRVHNFYREVGYWACTVLVAWLGGSTNFLSVHFINGIDSLASRDSFACLWGCRQTKFCCRVEFQQIQQLLREQTHSNVTETNGVYEDLWIESKSLTFLLDLLTCSWPGRSLQAN